VAHDLPENGAYALLEARHIDALTEAVRAQTTNLAISNDLMRKQIAALDRLTVVLERADAPPEDAASDVALDESTAGPDREPAGPAGPAMARTSSRDIPR
jgi:hypothetical protein